MSAKFASFRYEEQISTTGRFREGGEVEGGMITVFQPELPPVLCNAGEALMSSTLKLFMKRKKKRPQKLPAISL